METDRTRASDTERERVVERLRDAAAVGRLTVDELDARTEVAYGALTRGELAGLLDDLPAPREAPVPEPRRTRTPRVPGRLAFTASWNGPADPREAGADILEFLVPIYFAHGYGLVDRTADRLVLERRYQPAWTILASILVFPLGLLTLFVRGRDVVTIEMTPRDGFTRTVVQGVAPLGIRQAMVALED